MDGSDYVGVDAAPLGSLETVEVVDGTGGAEPVLVRMASVRPLPTEWLWPGRIPLGRVSFLVGDPGSGKSLLALDAAARVSRGRPWPDQEAPGSEGAAGAAQEAGDVLLLVADDSLAGAVRPRLEAAGADLARVQVLRAVQRREAGTLRRFSLVRDLAALERAIEAQSRVRLVVMDPLTAYLGHGRASSDAEVHDLLVPLEELAERTGVTVLVVSHLNKRGAGPLVQRAAGSIAFMAAARSVWAVGSDYKDPERRLLILVKSNVSASGTSLAFRIEAPQGEVWAPHLVWEPEAVPLTPPEAAASVLGRPPTERLAAAAWLRRLLANGPALAGDLSKEAYRLGIAWPTVKRARMLLGVISETIGHRGPRVWRLPCHPAPAVPPAPGTLAQNVIRTGSSDPDCGGPPRIAEPARSDF